MKRLTSGGVFLIIVSLTLTVVGCGAQPVGDGNVSIEPGGEDMANDPPDDPPLPFPGEGSTYALTVNIEGQGSVSHFSGEYERGRGLTLTAAPGEGWRFSHWEGDLMAATNPVWTAIYEDMTVTAVFTSPTVLESTYLTAFHRIADRGTLGQVPMDVAMSRDGKKLVVVGEYDDYGFDVWTMNTDGSDITRYGLTDMLTAASGSLTPGAVAINRDGSRAFVTAHAEASWHVLLFKIEGDQITSIELNKATAALNDIQTTSNGEYVYFLAGTPTLGTLWRVRHDGTDLELVIDPTEVAGVSGAGAVKRFVISDDASTIAFEFPVYYEDPLCWSSMRYLAQLFVLQSGNWRQLTDDNSTEVELLAVSPDGSTIVFASYCNYSPWDPLIIVRPDGTSLATLPLSGRGLATDDHGTLFVDSQGVTCDANRACRDSAQWIMEDCTALHMSGDGGRVAFINEYQDAYAVYVGYLNVPGALADAPTISSVKLDPPLRRTLWPGGPGTPSSTLTATITDPQGLDDIVEAVVLYPSAEHAIEGESGVVTDDGKVADETAGDGVFSFQIPEASSYGARDEVPIRIRVKDARHAVAADVIAPVSE